MFRSCAAVLAFALFACEQDSCFVAGTSIATPSGPRPIESLQVGDPVLAFDEITRRVIVRRIEHVLRRSVTMTRTLRFADRTLTTTDEHPFYDAEGGRWIAAADLQAQHVLAALDGERTRPLSAPRFELGFAPTEVWNLTVEGPEHTYFAEGIAVHNKSPPEPAWPYTVRLINQDERGVTVQVGAITSCIASQLWDQPRVAYPRERLAAPSLDVRLDPGGEREVQLDDISSSTSCLRDLRSGALDSEQGLQLRIGERVWFARLPAEPDRTLTVDADGGVQGSGSIEVRELAEPPVCASPPPPKEPQLLFKLEEGVFPSGGVLRESAPLSPGCARHTLEDERGDRTVFQVCAPAELWPFELGDSIDTSPVSSGVGLQARESHRRLELIHDARNYVEAVRMVNPWCLLPSPSEPTCVSGSVEHEVLLRGQWIRPGESVVGPESSDTLLFSTLTVMDSTCATSIEGLQLARVIR